MKLLRGDAPKPEANDDCRVLAPYVMTLFDGEADEWEARRARAHLLVCQTCARRWLDWNRSRDLLCSAPVPAPPPHLLWRVLMACRVAAAPQRAASRKAASRFAASRVAASRVAASRVAASRVAASRVAASRVAASRVAASRVELSGDLSARILARTTRRSVAASPVAASPVAALPVAALRVATSTVPFHRRAALALRMPALAVPALGVWMLILQRDVWLPAPAMPSLSASTRAGFRRPKAENSGRQATAPARRHAVATGFAAAPTAPVAGPARPEASEAQSLSGRRAASLEARVIAPASLTPGAPRSPHLLSAGLDAQAEGALEQALRLAASRRLSPEGDTRRAAVPAPGGDFQPRESDSPSWPRFAALPEVGRPPRLRDSRLRDSRLGEPRLGEPRLRDPQPRVAPLLSPRLAAGAPGRAPRAALLGAEASVSPQPLRVSLPSARAPQPSRLLAENFDSDDERLDEARSVVEDFRSTLGPDEPSTDTSNADTTGDENSG